jgi:hypothetical protein
MSITPQRRRGQPIVLYRSKTTTDSRGNKVQTVDEESPYSTRGWVIPGRSSRAEVPGQMDIDIVRIGVGSDFPGVDSWSRVLWKGDLYDVVIPPLYHHGTRHVRHWTIDLRKRP